MEACQITIQNRLINQIFCDSCIASSNEDWNQLELIDDLTSDSKKTIFLIDKKFKNKFVSNANLNNIIKDSILLKRRPIEVRKAKLE